MTAFYKELLDELIAELQDENIDPPDAEQFMRNRIREAVQNEEIEEIR